MDDENVQVPVTNRDPAAGDAGKPVRPDATGGPAGKHGAGGKKKPKNKYIAVVAVVVVVLALLAFGLWNVYRTTTGAQLDSGKYQAVFFTNGQVYFGKLDNLNGSYMKLTDVFYLQRQESDTDDSANPQSTDNQADLQLIKLGSEIHGPEDEMIISKDQVLFFENLKTDGRVTQSITEYKNNQNR